MENAVKRAAFSHYSHRQVLDSIQFQNANHFFFTSIAKNIAVMQLADYQPLRTSQNASF